MKFKSLLNYLSKSIKKFIRSNITHTRDFVFDLDGHNVTIHIGKYGGFKVNEEEFFSHPDVIRQIKEMRDYDVLSKFKGKKVVY